MNSTDYWRAIHRFYANTLSSQEVYYFRLAGVLAETRARERGTSLLPFPWQDQQVPPAQIDADILIVMGLTALVLQGNEPRSEPDGSMASAHGDGFDAPDFF